MPTTLRIALLAGLLALLSNLAVIGFIYVRTHDEAVASLHRQVAEQSKVLTDVYRSGGKTALDDAIDDTLTYADPQTAVALFGADGRQLKGNLAEAPVAADDAGGLSQRGHPPARPAEPAPGRRSCSASCPPGNGCSAAGSSAKASRSGRRSNARSSLALFVAGLLGLLVRNGPCPLRRRAASAISPPSPTGSARATSASACRSRARGIPSIASAMQINAMLDRIGGLMEELRLLTDSLAHDLRSPVSRLRAAAHAAAETSDPAEQEELLGSVVRNADALIRILTTVLEISRSEALTGRNQFAWFDVGDLAAELAEMYDPLADERGAALKFDRPDPRRAVVRPPPASRAGAQQPPRECDPLRLGRRRDRRPRAARRASASGIEVADRGPGIPARPPRGSAAALRPARLRAAPTRAPGLGLALAKSIAHLHEGELRLDDNGPGLLTALDLPVHQSRRRAERTRAAFSTVRPSARASEPHRCSFGREARPRPNA